MARGRINTIDNLNILENVEVIYSGDNDFSEFDITGLTKLIDLFLSSCDNLSVRTVNNIFINLDGYGLLNGYVSTAPVAPTGLGLVAKNNLVAKGWNIYT